MILYHGSQEIVEMPLYGYGNKFNDYGVGFYCTENEELAKEWACRSETGGYANRYELDTSGLNILNLNTEEFTVLNWITILLQNRTFSISNPLARDAKDYLIENFSIDYSDYDVIAGYRADDSYFAFAQDFINGAISVNKLAAAMKLGKLGEQFVLKSEKAYKAIQFAGYEKADASVYYHRRIKRDREARSAYLDNRRTPMDYSQLNMLDILRQEVKNDDPRLR